MGLECARAILRNCFGLWLNERGRDEVGLALGWLEWVVGVGSSGWGPGQGLGFGIVRAFGKLERT
jgi:hypothetical protein